MQNIDFFRSRELSCFPSHTRSKAFALVCWCPTVFISTQCATFMYTSLCHFKERMIVATLSATKIGLYWQQLQKNESRQSREKHYSVPWLLWAGWSMFSFVEVSGCMSPRLHPSFVLSLFFLGQITHPHIKYTLSPSSNTARDVSCWWLAVEGAGRVDTGSPQEAAAICFKSSVLSNGGGVFGEVGRGRGGGSGGFGGSAEEKWSPSCKGWRLGRHKEIFMFVIWRETEQLIGPRHRSLCLQRQLIHLLLILFVCPVSWIWLKSYSYRRLALCMCSTKALCRISVI